MSVLFGNVHKDVDLNALMISLLQAYLMPQGVIAMWSGTIASIPANWILCDGQNGTPDLRDKFIKGAAPATQPGAVGGALTHAHANHPTLVHAGAAVADHPALAHAGAAVANHSALAHIGNAVADHAAHTHTYTQVPNHVHVERLQGGTTGTTTGTHLMGSAATGGSLRSSAQSTLDPTGGVATGTTAGPSATLAHAVTPPNDHAVQAHAVTQPNDHAAQSHAVTQSADHAAQAHDVVNHEPPYYSLAFIMRV